MRCVTYNIHHGAEGLDNVANVLKELAPDLVFLQEVDRGCQRSNRVDQAAELAARLGLHFTFAEALPFDGGSYGVAVLTPEPPLDVRVIQLPHPEPRKESGWGEPRVALVIRGRGLTGVCTHLGLSEDERENQARVIRDALDGAGPLIVGGDLNEGPGGRVAGAWSGWITDAFQESGAPEVGTAPDMPPNFRPDIRIDGIYKSKEIPVPYAARVGPAGASDHRPVMVEFRL